MSDEIPVAWAKGRVIYCCHHSSDDVRAVRHRKTVIISSSAPRTEIIEHLTEHGCQDLTDDLDPTSVSVQPVSHGGYGSVYCEKLHDGRRVAIKALRVPFDDDDEIDKLPKRAARELYTWSRCQHPNVLPLLGLALFQDQIRMVSLWVESGSLLSYLEKHPDTDRYNVSTQVCDGVAYLHRTGTIHGDLKGNNILVSNEGVPMITDFGNATLDQGAMQFTETTKLAGCTPRWTAPEILEEKVPQSREADVYALGMTILEIMTGKPPYHYIRTVVALIRAVAIEKETPKRPEECIPSNTSYGDALWLLLTSCWEYEPEKRPRARNVLVQMMEGVTRDKSISPQAASVLEPEAEPEAGSVEDQPTKQHQQERGDSWFEHGPKEV